MSKGTQILSSQGLISLQPGEIRFQPTGLVDKDGASLVPHFVMLPAPVMLLARLEMGAPAVGGFLAANNTITPMNGIPWVAHYEHSVQQDQVPVITTASTLVSSTALTTDSIAAIMQLQGPAVGLPIGSPTLLPLPSLPIYRDDPVSPYLTQAPLGAFVQINRQGLYEFAYNLTCNSPGPLSVQAYLAQDPTGVLTPPAGIPVGGSETTAASFDPTPGAGMVCLSGGRIVNVTGEEPLEDRQYGLMASSLYQAATTGPGVMMPIMGSGGMRVIRLGNAL